MSEVTDNQPGIDAAAYASLVAEIGAAIDADAFNELVAPEGNALASDALAALAAAPGNDAAPAALAAAVYASKLQRELLQEAVRAQLAAIKAHIDAQWDKVASGILKHVAREAADADEADEATHDAAVALGDARLRHEDLAALTRATAVKVESLLSK